MDYSYSDSVRLRMGEKELTFNFEDMMVSIYKIHSYC